MGENKTNQTDRHYDATQMDVMMRHTCHVSLSHRLYLHVNVEISKLRTTCCLTRTHRCGLRWWLRIAQLLVEWRRESERLRSKVRNGGSYYMLRYWFQTLMRGNCGVDKSHNNIQCKIQFSEMVLEHVAETHISFHVDLLKQVCT